MAKKDLLIGIREDIVANPDITLSNIGASPDGVYLLENDAQQTYKPTDFPYVEITGATASGAEMDTGRTDLIENYDVTIKTFSKDVKKSLDISSEIEKMFLVDGLTLANGTVMCVQKFSDDTDIDPDKDTDGGSVKMETLILNFMVDFSLT